MMDKFEHVAGVGAIGEAVGKKHENKVLERHREGDTRYVEVVRGDQPGKRGGSHL